MRKINELGLLAPRRSGLTPHLKRLLACLTVVSAFSFSHAFAGVDSAPMTETDTKDMKSNASCCMSEKDWTLELGSGALWSNVRSGEPNAAYTIIPITLTASLKLDDVSLDNEFGGILRGYSEFFFQGDYNQIVRGPGEHRFEGLVVL